MNEKEIAALVEQTIKTRLKDYVRDVVQELAVAQAAEAEPEWSRKEGCWARGVQALRAGQPVRGGRYDDAGGGYPQARGRGGQEQGGGDGDGLIISASNQRKKGLAPGWGQSFLSSLRLWYRSSW